MYDAVSINIGTEQRSLSPKANQSPPYMLQHDISPFRTGEIFNKNKESRRQAQMKALRGDTWLSVDRKVWFWLLLDYGLAFSLYICGSPFSVMINQAFSVGFVTYTLSDKSLLLIISAFVLMTALYRTLYASDPGWLNNNSSLNTMPACQYCGIIPTLRSRHSNYTGSCVHKYDHYCWFLSTDIGDKNHCRFWTFVMLHFFMACCAWRMFLEALFNPEYAITEFTLGGYINQLSILRTLFVSVFCVALCVPILFLGYLLTLHTYLLLTNQTTYELLKGAQVPYLWPFYYNYSGPKRRHLPADFPRIVYSHWDGNPPPHPFSRGPLHNAYQFFVKSKPCDYQYTIPMPPVNWQCDNDLIFSEKNPSYDSEKNTVSDRSYSSHVEP